MPDRIPTGSRLHLRMPALMVQYQKKATPGWVIVGRLLEDLPNYKVCKEFISESSAGIPKGSGHQVDAKLS